MPRNRDELFWLALMLVALVVAAIMAKPLLRPRPAHPRRS